MKAVNGIGFHVEAFDEYSGWRRASKIMGSQVEAEAALKAMNEAAAACGMGDKVERRWQESLKGFHDAPQ
jgi:hypothetical protein